MVTIMMAVKEVIDQTHMSGVYPSLELMQFRNT